MYYAHLVQIKRFFLRLSIVRWIFVLAIVSADIFWINVETRGNWHLPKKKRKKLKYLFTGLKSQGSNGFISSWIKSDSLEISQHFKCLNVSKFHVEFFIMDMQSLLEFLKVCKTALKSRIRIFFQSSLLKEYWF